MPAPPPDVMPPGAVTWSLDTPATRPAAIAVATVRMPGAHAAAVFATLGISPVPVGGAAVRLLRWAQNEDAVVGRPDADTLLLMPHAGAAVLAAVTRGLAGLGFAETHGLTTEASLDRVSVDRRMLAALARTPSSLGVDLLLDQPRRWAALPADAGADGFRMVITPATPGIGPALGRLLVPPVVAAVGRPNIGKSSLANALAGRTVSVVADTPGTTRDHVGATLDLDGLTVQYADLPGLRTTEDALEAEAIRCARAQLEGADLVLLCGDAGTAPPEPDELGLGAHTACVRVGLRSDLGVPEWGADVCVSLLGVDAIDAVRAVARRIRAVLVPDSALCDQRAWRFWDW